jgi:hypothetical protein
MPEETRPEPSLPIVGSEQSIEEEPRELAAKDAKELNAEQIRRRAREVARRRMRVRPRGAAIGAPAEIAERAEERSGDPTPVRTSAAIASAEQSAAKKETVAAELISATSLHSSDAIAKSTAAVRKTTDDETVHDAVGSPEALPEETEEIKPTVTNEIGTGGSVPEAVAQAATERPAPWEIERKLKLAMGPQPTMRDVLARWRGALWEALHGRWSEAGWEFARGVFHLLTQAATWRRVGKAVLHVLARFIPGREPYVLRRSREIRELFQFLHEEPKKPGTWSNCPK